MPLALADYMENRVTIRELTNLARGLRSIAWSELARSLEGNK